MRLQHWLVLLLLSGSTHCWHVGWNNLAVHNGWHDARGQGAFASDHAGRPYYVRLYAPKANEVLVVGNYPGERGLPMAEDG